VVHRVLGETGADPDQIRAQLEEETEKEASKEDVAPSLAPDAKRALLTAYEESQALGSSYIGPEHVLLALTSDPGCAGGVLADWGATRDEVVAAIEAAEADALAALGISLAHVREEVEDRLGTAAWRRVPPAPRRLPFAPAAKRVLELALREALELGDRRVGPEHVLLALARCDETTRALLRRLCIPPDELRSDVLARMRA
jgi:ATP-dependent Clp protease ATP-binding subunit ClpA